MPQSKGRRKSKTVSRPTPPKSAHGGKAAKESSKLYQTIMFGLMAGGVLLVVVRYVFELSGWMVLGGLGAMGAGFVMTINYH